MPLPVQMNDFWFDGDVACLDVSTKTFPGVIARVDATEIAHILDGKGRWTAHKIRGHISVHRSVTVSRRKAVTEMLHRHVLGLPRSHYPSIVARDGDRTNCRRSNLIVTTPSGKGAPARHGRGSSKFKGVFLRRDNGRYRALIQVNRKLLQLGHYDTEIEAAKAYDIAAREHYGELAYINLPEELSHAG